MDALIFFLLAFLMLTPVIVGIQTDLRQDKDRTRAMITYALTLGLGLALLRTTGAFIVTLSMITGLAMGYVTRWFTRTTN